MAVERIHQGAAAAEEEGVGAPQVQGAGQRLLEAHPARLQPGHRVLRAANGEARQPFGGLALGHAQEVLVVLLLVVSLAQHRGRRVMHGAQVTGVARSEEHTSELQSLMRISYAVFCLKKKTKILQIKQNNTN